MAIVAPKTATKPDVKSSSKMVNVEFTNTLPSRILQSKKLPWSLTGCMARAYFFSFSVPVLHRI